MTVCDPLMKKNRFQRFLFLAFPCQFLFSVCAAVIGELIAIQRHGRVGPSVATPDTDTGEGGWGCCSVTMSRPHPLPLPGCHTSHCHAAAGVKLGPGNPSTSLPTPRHCRGQGCHPATTGGSKGFHCPRRKLGGASLHFCFGIIYFEGEMRTK